MVFRFRVCFYLSVQWRGWADIFPYLAMYHNDDDNNSDMSRLNT